MKIQRNVVMILFKGINKIFFVHFVRILFEFLIIRYEIFLCALKMRQRWCWCCMRDADEMSLKFYFFDCGFFYGIKSRNNLVRVCYMCLWSVYEVWQKDDKWNDDFFLVVFIVINSEKKCVFYYVECLCMFLWEFLLIK